MATDVTAWTVDKVKEWAEEQWPGSEVAEKLAGTYGIYIHNVCTSTRGRRQIHF